MHHTLLKATIALVVVASALSAAGTAAATTLQAGGSAVPPGTAVGAPLIPPATISTPNGVATCTGGRFAATVGINPSSPSVALTVSALEFGTPPPGSCTDTITGLNVTKATFTSSTSGAATYVSASFSTVTMVGLVLRVQTVVAGVPVACDLVPNNVTQTTVGTFTNANGQLAFTNAPFRPVTPSGPCMLFTSSSGGGASVSARYGPLKVTSSGAGVTVTP